MTDLNDSCSSIKLFHPSSSHPLHAPYSTTPTPPLGSDPQHPKIEVRAVITFKIKFVSEDRLDPNIRQSDCETKSNFRKSTWGCLAGMNPFAASGVE